MSPRRRILRRVGEVLSVPLGDGNSAFALVLEEPRVAFFDLIASDAGRVAVEDVVRSPVAFQIWVANQPIVSGEWPAIGSAAIPSELRDLPWFFKQDRVTGKITMGRTGAEEVPIDALKASELERAAVWSASQVIDRLRDHFAGRPNKWVESMRPQAKRGQSQP